MKKILLFTLLVSLRLIVLSQEKNTSTDQNPNYTASLLKYKNQQDKLTASMNGTVQETYKAYDWYEAKQERKQQRVDYRRERRLYELQHYYYPPNYYFDPFLVPYQYSPYHYNHSWRRWHR